MSQTSRLPLLLLGALWVAEMTSSFESAMILAALKVLVAEFHDPALVGWLVTGFLIVGAAAAALVGRLGDLFGRRKVLVVVLAIGAVGSLLSGISSNYALLLCGRIMQGVTGTILALCIGLVRENLPEDRVPMGIGLMISGASAGTAVGLIVGGLIVDHFTWHAIFMASAGFCLVSLLLVRTFIPASQAQPPGAPVDWFSGILFAPGVMLILLYLSNGKAWGWTSPAALGFLLLGIALCAWWLRQSLRSANPLIDVRVLGNRAIAVSCAASALVAMGTLQITVYFSLLLQAPLWTGAGLGLTATMAGLAKLPSNVTAILAGPLGGWMTGRGGGRLAMVTGAAITTLGWILVLLDTSSVAIVVGELIILSFGATMLFAVAPTIIAAASPPERTSEVSGMLGVIRFLFLGIGSQLVATLLATDRVQRGKELFPSPYAYHLTVGVIIALSIASLLVSLALPGGKTKGYRLPPSETT